MADDLSMRIREEVGKWYEPWAVRHGQISSEEFLGQTNLVSICQLYAQDKEGKEKLTFVVRDILDFARRVVHRSSDVAVVKEYLALFSEEGAVHKLKKAYGEKLASSLRDVTFQIAEWGIDDQYQPKDFERAATFLGSEEAVNLLVTYKDRPGAVAPFYEVLFDAAMKGPEQAQRVFACLEDERVRNVLMNKTMTFPEDSWQRLCYENEKQFEALVFAYITETYDADALVTFVDTIKNRWIATLEKKQILTQTKRR